MGKFIKNNRPKNIKTIEFVGLPGAGKTSIVDKISQKQNYQIMTRSIYSKLSKKERRGLSLFGTPFFLCVNFRLIYAILMFTISLNRKSYESRSFSFKLLRHIFFINNIKKYALKNNYKILMLDQGILQNIWSITVTSNINKSEMKKLMKKLRKFIGNSVINIDIDAHTVSHRIEKRDTSTSRFDQLDRKSLISILREKKEFLNELDIYFKDIEEKKVFIVNNVGPLEKVCNEIQDIILKVD